MKNVLFDQINNHRSLVLIITLALTVPGCAKLKNDNNTATGGGGGHADTSPSKPGASIPPSATGAATPTSWEAKANSLNGAEGQTLTLACSPGGEAHPVWGS